MVRFIIQANGILKQATEGFYHAEYRRGNCFTTGSIEKMICTLKNDIQVKAPADPSLLAEVRRLFTMLMHDLQTIKDSLDSELTVCVVPRAKVEYLPHQLYFKKTIKVAVGRLDIKDGTDYIIRTRNTRTTHRNNAGYGGDGPMPYEGITNNTCSISDEVVGKTILLIDDVYTPGIDIDEDAIQALIDKGASRVIFYAIGHTIRD